MQQQQGCLIYIEADSDVNGTTRQGSIVSHTFDKNDNSVYIVDVLTTQEGYMNKVPETFIASEEDIVSLRSYHEIDGKIIFYFSTDGGVTASRFLKKSDDLTDVSMRPIGSGIVGTYFRDDNIPALSGVEVFSIEMKNPYQVQDVEHYNSILNASLRTNMFIESLRRSVETINPEIRSSEVMAILTTDSYVDFQAIYTLWWIVLWRTEDTITEQSLMSIIVAYIDDLFVRNGDLIDTITGSELIELPVNYIFKSLGYTGVISEDNDSVNYEIEAADEVRASSALYTTGSLTL